MTQPVFDILLEKLTYGGEAMGRLPDGRAVFVPFGLPGEQVRVELVEEKKGFARGILLEILKTSPEELPRNANTLGSVAAVIIKTFRMKNN